MTALDTLVAKFRKGSPQIAAAFDEVQRRLTVLEGPPVVTPPVSIVADGTSDVTAALTAWFATVPNISTVEFPRAARYRVEGTIELKGRTLTLAGGAFFALGSAVEGRSMWRLRGGKIAMRGMDVSGSYFPGGVFNAALQHAHGIEVLGADVDLDVAVLQVAGDCVYFGLDGTTAPTGTVHDSSLTKCGRNAVSIVAGHQITIQRNVLDEVGYDVIDLEPNIGVTAGVIDGVLVDGNTIGERFGVTCYSLVPNQPIRNVTFSNNRAEVGKLSSADLPVRPSNIRFIDNVTVKATTASFNNIDGLAVSGNSPNYTILKAGVPS